MRAARARARAERARSATRQSPRFARSGLKRRERAAGARPRAPRPPRRSRVFAGPSQRPDEERDGRGRPTPRWWRRRGRECTAASARHRFLASGSPPAALSRRRATTRPKLRNALEAHGTLRRRRRAGRPTSRVVGGRARALRTRKQTHRHQTRQHSTLQMTRHRLAQCLRPSATSNVRRRRERSAKHAGAKSS